jgi:dTDP-4-amino-4,6-dideoxygalactose transaminase
VTESASSRLVRLPLYYDMSPQEANDVVAEIFRFFRESPGFRELPLQT